MDIWRANVTTRQGKKSTKMQTGRRPQKLNSQTGALFVSTPYVPDACAYILLINMGHLLRG
jgi:hypothetical protein